MSSEALVAGLLRYFGEATALVDVAATPAQIVAANAAFATRCDVAASALAGVALGQALGVGDTGGSVPPLTAAANAGASVSIPVARLGARGAVLRCEPVAGSARHYLCFLEPVAEPAPAPVAPAVREDWLTGLRHAEFFQDVLQRDFAVARRERRELSVFVIDIDALGLYADTFGRVAADAVVRGVARQLANCFRRASDVLVRAGEGRFFALATSLTPEQAEGHARLLASRIRDLHLHHPRAPGDRRVTVSVGLGHGVPGLTMTPDGMLTRACAAADAAAADGAGRISVAALTDG